MASQIEVEELWWKLEIVPKLLNEKKILTDLNSVENVQIANINIQLIGAEEAFMLTKCYRICVTFKYPGGGDKEMHFFVKKTPQVPQTVFDVSNFKALFNNEILAYETILPALENFGNIKLNTAKLFYAELKPNYGTVIIEDFTHSKWMITKDRFNLSRNHIVLAIKYLAQFHAVGFALRGHRRQQFETLTQGLMEARFSNEPHPKYALIMKCGNERAIRAVREYHKEVPKVFVDKLANLLGNSFEYSKNLVKPKEPYVTLCHGDFLRNNVAYRYGEGKNCHKPLEVMMFDFQTLRVGSPMLDLSVFLALSTLAEVRHTHFQELFEVYCEGVKEKYEKITQKSLPEYLRFESLLKEYIRFLTFGITISAVFLSELIEPRTITGEDFLNVQPSDEEIIQDAMTRGGEVLNRELGHQIKELYNFVEKYNVEIF